MEMECKHTIYMIKKAWKFLYDNLQCYLLSRLRKEHNAADNR